MIGPDDKNTLDSPFPIPCKYNMKMRNESVDNAIEDVSGGSAPLTSVPTNSHESGIVPVSANDPIDERKAPPVFSSVCTEFVSILTLAFAPGLNVSPALQCERS